MKLFSKLFLFLIIFSSCKKQKVNIKSADQNITLKSPEGSNVSMNSGSLNASNSWINESSFIKSQINSGKTSSLGVPDKLMFEGSWRDRTIGAVHIRPDSMWRGDLAGRSFIGYTDGFTMLPEWLGQKDNFYLGNLIKGNTISTVDLSPLSERLGQYASSVKVNALFYGSGSTSTNVWHINNTAHLTRINAA